MLSYWLGMGGVEGEGQSKGGGGVGGEQREGWASCPELELGAGGVGVGRTGSSA